MCQWSSSVDLLATLIIQFADHFLVVIIDKHFVGLGLKLLVAAVEEIDGA